jgi:hypothetical protein
LGGYFAHLAAVVLSPAGEEIWNLLHGSELLKGSGVVMQNDTGFL